MTQRRLRCKRVLTLSVFAAVASIGAGCRSKPVDTQELLTAQSLGLRDLQRGMLTEAEQQFKRVASLAPRDPLGYANLGLTYLRGGRYAEAEAELKRARKLNPQSAEVALILAKLYSLTGRSDEARRTLEQLPPPPDARVLYALAELDASGAQHGDSAALRLHEERLRQLLGAAPANLAVRLDLVDVLLRRGLGDSALHHLEEVRRLRPEPPKEAKPALDSTIQLLRAGQVAEAQATFDRFAHALELTAPYQESLEKVKWVEGPLVGRPVLEFNPQSLVTTRGFRKVGSAEVRFTDVTDEAGLTLSGTIPTALATGDYDGNGTDNLFVSLVKSGDRPVVRVYNVQRGYVADVTARAGISLPDGARYATFADFDNDGWLDLYVIGGDGRGYLLRNNGKGGFDDVSAKAGLSNAWGSRKALFVDIDHDGDLDLLLVGGATNRLYQNNLDGTFTEIGDAAGLAGTGVTNDAAIGDFDGDGRIDVVLADSTGVNLYRNTGLLHFQNVSAASGLASAGAPAGRLAVGDYDNDGLLDIFVANVGPGEPTLWRNLGGGRFVRDQRAAAVFQRLGRTGVVDVSFVDYDNDGRLDLVAVGRRGVFLFRNEGSGRFTDRSNLLPVSVQTAGRDPASTAIAVTDVDGDGDEDLFVGDSSGVRLLRNDGGNSNLAMQVQLVGLRTGSGKNNTFGIGSKIEVRAGEIYQTQVVTSRVTHFGLGPHLKADVLRVQWTNGVPQTIYFPGTDADVLELEQLKGSCAFLYTWDGKQFRFVTDVMWRSALGMPVGIMGGGQAAYAPAGASQEYLRIPGDALQPRDGRYVLQLTEELWETAFLDEVRLVAVDHPDSVDVFVDERFVPPGPVNLRLFHAAGPRAPVSATDGRGHDVLPALRERDFVYVSDFTPTQYQGLVEPHDLILDLGGDAGRAGTFLFLRGWIYPTDASINVALSQQSKLKAALPSLEVRNARGEWEMAIANIGFPSGKDKTIVVDLTGTFPTRDHRVRIRTNMQIYWDQAFVATDAVASPVRTTSLRVVSANLHFRGFSRMYRRGGPYGPQWFAYDDVSTSSPWRTIEGAFTRFGDVSPLLKSADDMFAVMAPGDEASVEFDAASTPALPPGWKRTFLLYSDGWIKDADLNTAFGNTVAPLPFHSIQAYPYAPGDSYPADAAHQRYLREFNTRVMLRR
jgi:tetratricopeptide (TPR) repeat protein